MKSKKVTMLAAALVVAVIAAAGIGYATQYTATTTNSQNVMDSTYMTLKQDDQAGYTQNFFTGIVYNTVNVSASVNKYTPVFGYRIDADTSKVVSTAGGTEQAPLPLNMAKISKDLELTIDTTKSADTSVSLKVTVSDFTPQTGLVYRLIVTNEDETIVTNGSPTYNNGWTIPLTVVANSATDNVFNVALYVECTTAIEITGQPTAAFNTAGFTNYNNSDSSNVVEGSIFTFVVTAETA